MFLVVSVLSGHIGTVKWIFKGIYITTWILTISPYLMLSHIHHCTYISINIYVHTGFHSLKFPQTCRNSITNLQASFSTDFPYFICNIIRFSVPASVWGNESSHLQPLLSSVLSYCKHTARLHICPLCLMNPIKIFQSK